MSASAPVVASTNEITSVRASAFCAWPEFSSDIELIGGENETLLATVLYWDKSHFNSEDYDQLCAVFAEKDDVWNQDFLDALILRAPGQVSTNISSPTTRFFRVVDADALQLPDGPFMLKPKQRKITSVARLQQDHLQSFIGGGIMFDAKQKQYRWLGANGIAVPSRLYYSKSATKPLSGLRFAVKDAIDVAGLESSWGSRAYRDACLPSRSSAPFIHQLTDAGAILVGKTMCDNFGDVQIPTERFDYFVPINPRGDSFQLPSGSSSGSATSCAGYSWLDFTIGTDTGGSIRHPAGVNGIYGMRPTLTTVDSSGMSVSTLLDTTGVFSRSAHLLETASKCIASPSYKFTHPAAQPTRFKLLYPTSPRPDAEAFPPKWFPVPTQTEDKSSAESIFESIVKQLEKYLDCQRQPFNMNELWNSTHADASSGNNLDATGTIYQDIVYHSIAHKMLSKFFEDYKTNHSGREPRLEPQFRQRLDYGRNVTTEQHEEAITRLEKLSDWIKNSLLVAEDEEVIPLLVYPQGWGKPSYRDYRMPADAPKFWEAFSSYSISYASGCPDITVPVGEVEFQSKISMHAEFLPVSLSFITPPGTDFILLELLRKLEEQGILKSVEAGQTLYSKE